MYRIGDRLGGEEVAGVRGGRLATVYHDGHRWWAKVYATRDGVSLAFHRANGDPAATGEEVRRWAADLLREAAA